MILQSRSFTVKRKKKKQERWPVRSKQAVRHSIVRRRESLQHKPTLHGQHKTWLLVPFYYHKTGGGKIKSGSVNVSLNQARSGWFLSHRSKYWLLYINLKNCMTSAWVPCCWLFSKKHINQRQICNTHVFKDTMHAKRKKNNKCLM